MKRYSRDELLNRTPSRKDGVDAATERQARKQLCNFIKKMVQDLKLQSWTLETAAMFTHRFFAVRSIAKNDRFLVAASSVFLACKVDESPRALRDVAYVMYATKNSKKPAEMQQLLTNTDVVLKEPMEHLLLAERAILYTLAFDLNVDHPYTHLVKALKKLDIDVSTHTPETAPNREFFQQAVNLLNDSLATTLCLQYDAATLAHAVMYEVARLSPFNLRIPDNQTFQDYFSITQAELDDIVPQIMALYDKRSKVAAVQAPTGDATAPPQAPPSQSRAGPPLPSFRPIIIPHDGQPPRLTSASRARGGDVEEGELPSSTPRPTTAAPAPAPATVSALCVQHNGPAAAAENAVSAVDSDAEDGIRHAPGSGDQNNHNEPDSRLAEGQQAVLEPVTRKRTRSPGALEEGEIGFIRCKSPCVSQGV